jgi:hypothetical protein
MVMLPNSTQYYAGGYIQSTPNVDPFALAAAGLALGLDESEFAEFATRFNGPLPTGFKPEYAYQYMIEVAYQIKKRRGTIANG